MTKLSEVIAQLEAIRASHGDIPIYAFEEYGTGPRTVNICLVEEPSPFDKWLFPHVQISP